MFVLASALSHPYAATGMKTGAWHEIGLFNRRRFGCGIMRACGSSFYGELRSWPSHPPPTPTSDGRDQFIPRGSPIGRYTRQIKQRWSRTRREFELRPKLLWTIRTSSRSNIRMSAKIIWDSKVSSPSFALVLSIISLRSFADGRMAHLPRASA
jgi:hypothetical protein